MIRLYTGITRKAIIQLLNRIKLIICESFSTLSEHKTSTNEEIFRHALHTARLPGDYFSLSIEGCLRKREAHEQNFVHNLIIIV